MKLYIKILLLLAYTSVVIVHRVYPQDINSYADESENLHIMTNQDIFFAGEKLWFGLKLLKNHDSYRFSKLVYLEIYSPDHNLVHQEKLLLDPNEMTYGDVILPDNLSEGEYKIFAYTKWMLNFPSYPIAKKSVLVKRFNPTIEDEEDIQLFYSEKEGPYRELLFFHTSNKPLLIEIESLAGRQEAIFEEIPPFMIFNTKMQFDTTKNIIWGKKKMSISPSAIRLIEDHLEINTNLKYHNIYVHNDLEIIESLDNNKIDLTSKPYEKVKTFQVTLLDEQNHLVAHEYFSKSQNSLGTISAPKTVKRGEKISVNIRSTNNNGESGMAWVKSPEPEGIQDIIQVLNNPVWKMVSALPNEKGNYIQTIIEIQNTKTLSKRKEYLPLMEYNPLQSNLKDTKPELFQTSAIIKIPDFQSFTDFEMKRRVFHEHFNYDAAVSVPTSPYLVDYTYDVQDYEGYKTIEDFMKEVVTEVRLRKNKITSQNEIRLFNPNMKRKDFKSIPLLLIDFYEVTDPTVILDYDINQIDRIEVIYLRNTIDATNLGALSENGIVALFTRKNDFQLKYNVPQAQYILKELNVPRVMSKEMVHAEASSDITLHKPQSWHPAIPLERGRNQFKTAVLDEPGKLKVEAWIFYDVYPHLLQTELEVK